MAKKSINKKPKLLQSKKAMREELSFMGDYNCEMIAQLSGVSLNKIKKFCQTGEISDADLLKIDKVNRM